MSLKLIEILKSNDAEIRSRGVSLLYSILTISPLKILNSFQDYSNILTNYLEGPGLETINLLIVEQTIKEKQNINEISAPFLINYFCYFVENPFLIEKISLEQDISSTTQLFYDAIKSLFINKSENVLFCFPERLRSLLATKDDFYMIKNANENEEILNNIINEREPSLTYLIGCLNSETQSIIDYSTRILTKLKEKEPTISAYISKFVSLNNELSNNNNGESLNECNFIDDTKEDTYKTTLQFLIKNSDKFVYIEPSKVNFHVKKTDQQVSITYLAQSFLNKAHLIQPTVTQSQRRPSAVKQDFDDLPISAMLQKQGKFKKWQERYFEFFPASRCLLWRSKSDDPKVKGVLIFDQTYDIKQINEKNKFILQLTPKNGKQYFLAFSNSDERSKWFTMITHSISK